MEVGGRAYRNRRWWGSSGCFTVWQSLNAAVSWRRKYETSVTRWNFLLNVLHKTLADSGSRREVVFHEYDCYHCSCLIREMIQNRPWTKCKNKDVQWCIKEKQLHQRGWCGREHAWNHHLPTCFLPFLSSRSAGRPLLLLARVHCLHVTMGHICSPERTRPGHWWFRELAWCSKWALGFWSHFLTLYLFTERIRRLNRELGASQTLDSVFCWFCLYRDSMFDLGKWIPPFSLAVEYLQSWL